MSKIKLLCPFTDNWLIFRIVERYFYYLIAILLTAYD